VRVVESKPVKLKDGKMTCRELVQFSFPLLGKRFIALIRMGEEDWRLNKWDGGGKIGKNQAFSPFLIYLKPELRRGRKENKNT
jgi:hypothetical protein